MDQILLIGDFFFSPYEPMFYTFDSNHFTTHAVTPSFPTGPPYKALDNYFSANMQSSPDTHIYLYNKKALTSTFKIPSVELRPEGPIELQSIGNVPSSSAYLLESPNLSPLLKILPEYERRFLTQYYKGKALSLYTSDLLVSVRKSFNQFQTQQSALAAVVSNLSDHYRSVSSAFNSVQSKIALKLEDRKQLLESFDVNLKALGEQYIHQALVPHAEKFLNPSSSSSSSSSSSLFSSKQAQGTGAMVDNLMDENTVPLSLSQSVLEANTCDGSSMNNVNITTTEFTYTTRKLSLLECLSLDKELKWKSKCEEACSATEKGLNELKDSYRDVQTGVNTVETDQSIITSSDDNERFQSLTDSIEQENSQQAVDVDQLKASHISSLDELQRVVALLRTEGNDDEKATLDEGLRKLVDNFEQQFKIHQDILLPSMQERVEKCTKYRKDIIDIRSAYLRHMYKSLKKAGEEQTKIHKLKRRIEMMAKLYKGQSEYFRHLTGVCNLSSIYDAFVVEVLRRKEFSALYGDKIDSSLDEITSLRQEEITKREKFIRKYGDDLPAVFMNVVPSIREKPPFLTTSLTAKQWLPDIELADLSPTQASRLRHIKESLVGSSERSSSRNSNINNETYDDKSGTQSDIVNSDPTIENEILQQENNTLRKELEELKSKSVTVNESADSRSSHAQVSTSTSFHHSNSETELTLASILSTLSSITTMIEMNPTNIEVPSTRADANDSDFGDAVMELLKYYIDAVHTQHHEMNVELVKSKSLLQEYEKSSLTASNQLVGDLSPSSSALPVKERGSSKGDDVNSSISSLLPSLRDYPKISFRSFDIGDVALFCPVNQGKDVYVAFNLACPLRYLSPDSLRTFREEVKDGKKVHRNIDVYILGRIVFIEARTAADDDKPTSNPFNLPEGTVYYLIDAAAIDTGSTSGGGGVNVDKIDNK